MSNQDEFQAGITLGQSVNLAVQVITADKRFNNEGNVLAFESAGERNELDRLTDFFFNYIKNKRREVFTELSKPKPVYKPFKPLTADEYEALPDSEKEKLQQQKKDNNKVKYAEHKKVGKLRVKCSECDRYGYEGEPCRYCEPETVGDRENMKEIMIDAAESSGWDGRAATKE